MVTVRLEGERTVREVAVDGLAGSTRVDELLLRAAVALGLPGEAAVALRCKLRFLKADKTLFEAGVPVGGAVDVFVGECGGMPGFARRLSAVEGWRAERGFELQTSFLRKEVCIHIHIKTHTDTHTQTHARTHQVVKKNSYNFAKGFTT